MLPLFATPWAFAALAALPALTTLYWLRNSYRQVRVSSLMLWLDTEARASGLRVRRLQTPLLFFLELAALILLAIAATGPRIEIASSAWPLVVVLDDSYSMRAGGDASPRALAQQALERDLRWSSLGSVRFVLAGTRPQMLGDAATDLSEAREALRDWHCQAPAGRLPEALALATELAGSDARILVLTDKKPPDDTAKGRIVWWAFGGPRPNLAIIRASRAGSDEQDRCAIEVANFSPGPQDTTLVVETLADARPVHRERLSLAPREIRRLRLRIAGEAGPVRMRLSTTDVLAIDDEAFLVREEVPPIRVDVRLADEGLRGLVDRALLATGKVLPPRTKSHLLITDAAEVPPVDAECWTLQVLAEKEADAYLGPFVLERTHPLTEGLHLAGVVWGAGKSHELIGAPIVMAGNVPLLADAESANGQHRLRLRLRADLSTLPQSPAWPVLLWNLVHWRAGDMPGLKQSNLRLGDPAVLAALPGSEKVEVSGPAGTARALDVKARRVVIPADDIGLYEVREGSEVRRFGVSTFNAEESDLSAVVTGRWGEWVEEGVAAPGVVHLAWLFLLLALAVLSAHLALATRVRGER